MCTTDFSVIWKTTLTELGKSPNCPHSQILPMTHWPSTHRHHPEMTLCSWHTDLRPINITLRWRCAAERTKSTAVYPFVISHFCRLPLFLLLSWSLHHGINRALSYPKDWTPESTIFKVRKEGMGSASLSNPPEYKQDSMFKSTSTLSWVWCLPPYNHINQKCASFT